jgi:hypothetical protein
MNFFDIDTLNLNRVGGESDRCPSQARRTAGGPAAWVPTRTRGPQNRSEGKATERWEAETEMGSRAFPE